ncbi:hypothetical protein [Jeotgalibaca sp. A122]|uniref:hypothetical protein n=1 Tax=Jeotgalibaca sp. A122 TaxID=3457322 RepID=UPI003FCFF1C4
MQNATFPIDYFRSTLTPVSMFRGRKFLSWPKIIFVILFLNGLMMIPIVLNYADDDSFSLEPTYPIVFDMVDEAVVTALNSEEAFFQEKENGVVVGGGEESAALEYDNVLYFGETEMVLKEGDSPVTRATYTKDLEWGDSVESVRSQMSRQWYYMNRVFIVATYSFMIAGMLLLMNVLLIVGAAFFMYLAGKNSIMELDTFKESINVILNAVGLPVLASLVVGLFLPEITTMMSVQSMGLVLMIVLLYFKTRFSEQYIQSQEDK